MTADLDDARVFADELRACGRSRPSAGAGRQCAHSRAGSCVRLPDSS
jgi:hypothetical protein